jgi:hypothetical protein
MRSTEGIRGYRKALLYAGSVAALAGAGTAVASSASAAVVHHPAVVRQHAAPARPSAARTAKSVQAAKTGRATTPMTWHQVLETQAHRMSPKAAGALTAAEVVRPVAFYGPQENMPLTAAQYENAKTIVHQALAKKMGVRAAVVAVATAMQESELNNLNYGDRDSLGLFQQRPSCGWGTAAQIMDPAYAADAFLGALAKYQAENPGWAHQPLWQAAQGVQASGFPTAYAKWEAQAADMVQQITTQLTR